MRDRRLTTDIRVGLGKHLDRDTKYYSLDKPSQNRSKQIEILKEALEYHLETNKNIYVYQFKGDVYVRIDKVWLKRHITSLTKELLEKGD